MGVLAKLKKAMYFGCGLPNGFPPPLWIGVRAGDIEGRHVSCHVPNPAREAVQQGDGTNLGGEGDEGPGVRSPEV